MEQPTATQVDDSLSVLGSVDTLKQALQFPGMKFCLKEYFNMDRATALLEAPPGVLSADHRKKLNRFLKHAAKDPETKMWCVEAKYDFSARKNPHVQVPGYRQNSWGCDDGHAAH